MGEGLLYATVLPPSGHHGVEEEQGFDPKHKGCINELRATAWLIGLGYYVCRNVSQHGPVDLVAIRGDEVILIDVKSTSMRNDGTRRLNRRRKPAQVWFDVRILLVSEDSVFWAEDVAKTPAGGGGFFQTEEEISE